MNEIDAKHYPRPRREAFHFTNICAGVFVMKCDLSSDDVPSEIRCGNLMMGKWIENCGGFKVGAGKMGDFKKVSFLYQI